MAVETLNVVPDRGYYDGEEIPEMISRFEHASGKWDHVQEGWDPNVSASAAMSPVGLGRSLIPGLWSSLSKNVLAGFMVLSAVGACPPHDGVG
jgi:hypothetical protein